MNQEKIKSTLLAAAKDAGIHMKSNISARGGYTEKAELSIVTKTDKECEKIVLDYILGNFPNHSILSEESPEIEGSSSRWIIDPIDGTTNFAHTYPVSCVSIAYEEDGEVILGAVYDPFKDELFFAEKGKGAFLNDEPIATSKVSTLGSALLATGFPYDRREYIDEYLGILKTFVMTAQGIRRTGSSAIDLCYVACGRFDGYWEVGLAPWDKAAAMLIIQEAGGKVSSFTGEPLTIHGKQNLATNGLIHDFMIEALNPHKEIGSIVKAKALQLLDHF